MGILTGAKSKLAIKLGTTSTAYGTSVALGSGHLTPFASFSWGENAGVLSNSPNGLGKVMATDGIRGAVEPSWSLEKVLGFQDGGVEAIAQFFGTSGSPTEVTSSQGDYKHTMTLNTTLNNVFATIGYQSSTSTAIEFPSASVTSMTIKAEKAPGYATVSFTGNSNKIELSPSTNTFSAIDSATLADDEEAIVDPADSFLINALAGSTLSSGDKLNITSFTLTLNRPQAFVHEIKGSAGNSAPDASDLVSGTLQVVCRGVSDHTYFTAAQAETAYKCKFSFDGSQIGSGTNKAFNLYIPKMKLLQSPDAPVSSPGNNPLTLNFDIYAATSNPSGMSSVYPYLELTNARSSAYIS